MAMTEKEGKIFIRIESPDNPTEQEELELLSHNLCDELNELDAIEKVSLITKEGEQAPEGSKSGGEVAVLGSLLVTLGGSLASNVIPSLANTLQSWVTRQDRHTISLEIGGDKLQLTSVSDKQQEKLIDAWISRHTEKT
jgi:hypothetical protein